MEHYGRIYLRKSMCNFLKIKFNRRKNEVHKIGHLSIEYKLIFINLGYICSYRSIQKSCITIFVSIINQMYQRTGYRTPRHPLDSNYLCMKMEWPGNISHIKLTKYDRLQCTQIQRYIMRMIRAGFGKKTRIIRYFFDIRNITVANKRVSCRSTMNMKIEWLYEKALIVRWSALTSV